MKSTIAGVFLAVAGILMVAAWAGAEPQAARYIVTFHALPGAAEEALVRSHGGAVRHTYRIVPAIAAELPEAAVAALAKNPRIERIEADVRIHAIDAELDNAWGVKHIGAGAVHDLGNRGAGVKVAVIDTGIDRYHPDLSVAGGYDFVNRDSDPHDDNGHGSHVAGSLAALDNGFGVVGVAPVAAVYALKVLDSNGSGYFSDVIAAVEWCANNGIEVTNNSYGSSSNPGLTVAQAFAAAEAAGVLHIAAAGNAGNKRGSGDNIGYPARFSSVVAVAATDASDKRASFSSTGAAAELAAPGVAIYSTWRGGGYATLNGTSMASPHVAGVAALVIAQGVSDQNSNGRTNDEVRERLGATAKDLGAAGWDSLYGYGLVDAIAAVGLVVPPPSDPSPTLALELDLSTDKATYRHGEQAIITAVATDQDGSPVEGVRVALTIETPRGRRYTGTGTTDGSGTVRFGFKVNVRKDGTGVYHVSGVASKDGYTDGSGATSFQAID